MTPERFSPQIPEWKTNLKKIFGWAVVIGGTALALNWLITVTEPLIHPSIITS
ncbi:hypothetical protein ACFLZP_04710 [Patescibacteria group bacterium]